MVWMARYDITRACGHDDVVNIGGAAYLRDWKVARERLKDCRPCWETKRHEQRIVESAEAAALAAQAGLPALDGGPNQTARAETLRAKTIALLADWQISLAAAVTTDLDRWTASRLAELVDATVTAQTTARWWIDNGDEINLYLLVKDLVVEEIQRERAEHEAELAARENAVALDDLDKPIAEERR